LAECGGFTFADHLSTIEVLQQGEKRCLERSQTILNRYAHV
jgi:hypothetical protein